jgi:putative ABC transport system ATP-binding protein
VHAPLSSASDFRTNGSVPIFEAQGLRKVYHTGEVDVVALNKVDVEFREGELVVLLGASGSGKSTLLNILGGLDIPTSGRIRYKGWEITDADENVLTQFRRNCVGFVFQFYNLIPSLTARENVALITDIARDPMTPEEALDLVGLADRMDHFPSQLSGGQQQRVAIARAIAKRPEVLLCDEPTGALDITTGITVLEAIEAINRDLGTLAVIITHNASMAEMADRVLYLSDGNIVKERRNPTRKPVRSLEW